ncbi:hypothetical protein, conserved [Leishmania tarentolae]|uniref:Uncharacterized protein n=1 Tax=Leishmania tarentolae TaxID=5689 RepID=A0A640KWJ9_LEITA|nr:hypothetical protein, conserved [Leishmania tarentolae]
MTDAAVRERVVRLRQSAAPLRDVYGAFSPWQTLSTSVRGLDSLLSVTGVCGGVSDRDARCSTNAALGGFPVGGLHELYGPPLCGKSWLLRRVGAAYVRRMTMYRQLYHDKLEQVSKWAVEAPLSECTCDEVHARKDDEGLCGEGEVANVCADSASASPVTMMEEWDLYVCLVSGAGAGSTAHQLTAVPPLPSLLSPDVQNWMEELVAPFGSSFIIDKQGGPVATEYAHRKQQQRDYAEQHIHFRVVHSPNELLAFLEHLSDSATSAPPTATTLAENVSSTAPQVPLGASQRQYSSSQLPRDSSTTTVRAQKRHRSPGTSMSSLPLSSPCGNLPQHTWRLQRQRLLLLDGLDALWLHPSLGNHCATHTGQWFAEELHRRLRAMLLPRLSYAASNSAAPSASPHSQHTLYSTVVLTNGCNRSRGGVLTEQQLEARLAGSVGAAEGWTAALPRPSGNAVWCMAADTRCLVEPAHPRLVSLTAPISSHLRPAKMSHDPRTMRQNGRSIAGTFGWPTVTCRESLVTVVKGGSRVAATWVLRDVADGEQET